MKNLISKIRNFFNKKPEKKTLRELYNETHPEPKKLHKPGRGPYFSNNRKRTNGRNIQYVAMPDGRTRVIRHETV